MLQFEVRSRVHTLTGNPRNCLVENNKINHA